MKDIKFIDYDGNYPNLCRGVLVVLINGEKVKFGHHYSNYKIREDRFTDEDPEHPNYPSFWESGGEVSFIDNDYDVERGPWNYDGSLDKYEFTREDIEKLMELFNENVPYGCCGGCI